MSSKLELLGAVFASSFECENVPAPLYNLIHEAYEELERNGQLDVEQFQFWYELGQPSFTILPEEWAEWED
jgi:hypothetical protein